MMTDATARFALPWLQPGQAQKEMFHNEALTLVDLTTHPVVETVGTNTPPANPLPGQCWIVGSTPAGAWTGQAGRLAGWTAGGWRFVAPVTGMAVWSLADGVAARWTGAGWTVGTVAASRVEVAGLRVVGARQPAIAAPAGGATVDTAARGAISEILQALRSHGLIAT